MTELRYNVKEALDHYREFAAFIANAVDSMEWYVEEYTVSSQIRHITQCRADTMTFKAHMDKALDAYRQLCETDGNIRPYNVIMRKFVDPEGGSDGKGKPFTNDQLAGIFGCSVETILRDVKKSRKTLSILFFGIHGIESDKQSIS